MEVNIKVSTEVLRAKADSITSMADIIAERWEELKDTAINSRSYWEGKRNDHHQKQINDISNDAETMIKRLREHPQDLLKMAGIYETTEKDIAGSESSLPADVIE